MGGAELIPQLWLAGGALALLAATHGFVGYRAYNAGKSAEAARHAAVVAALQSRIVREADALSRRALELQQQEAELSARAMEAEDAARSDFDARRVPNPDSLRRLERRWGGAGSP